LSLPEKSLNVYEALMVLFSGNDKYQISNNKWKMKPFIRFAIY